MNDILINHAILASASTGSYFFGALTINDTPTNIIIVMMANDKTILIRSFTISITPYLLSYF